MSYVVLYLGIFIASYIIASRFRSKLGNFTGASKVLLVSISVLVFIMGMRMGSNEEIISNLGTIGVEALLITLVVFAGSVLSVFAVRILLGMDRYGNSKRGKGNKAAMCEVEQVAKSPEMKQAAEVEEGGGSGAMTAAILFFVAVGLLVGYFLVRVKVQDLDGFNDKCGSVMTVILCIMLFAIGLDMGITGTVIESLKKAGFKVLMIPAAIMIGTAVTGVVCGLIFPNVSIKEALAICYGFGWYTFAPVAITGEGYVVAGAISFMHNVFRELIGLILIPFVAKYIGYLESCSLPGVAAMDIGMPIVEQSTNQSIMIFSFAVGLIESMMVPVIVPLVIGL